jgi:hypothetical protein
MPQPSPNLSGALGDRPGSRHVSNNIEPSFAQSIRRGDNRAHERTVPETSHDDFDIGTSRGDYESPMVSFCFTCIPNSNAY